MGDWVAEEVVDTGEVGGVWKGGGGFFGAHIKYLLGKELWKETLRNIASQKMVLNQEGE